MSHQRHDLGLKNRDGSISRRAVRMKVGTRHNRRKNTKSAAGVRLIHTPRAREMVRRAMERAK